MTTAVTYSRYFSLIIVIKDIRGCLFHENKSIKVPFKKKHKSSPSRVFALWFCNLRYEVSRSSGVLYFATFSLNETHVYARVLEKH